MDGTPLGELEQPRSLLVAQWSGEVEGPVALQALVATYAAKKAIVDESSARAAVTEITAE